MKKLLATAARTGVCLPAMDAVVAASTEYMRREAKIAYVALKLVYHQLAQDVDNDNRAQSANRTK